MASGTITTALILVWMINILMIFSQFAINDMTNGQGLHYMNCSNTIIRSYSTNSDCTAVSAPNSNNLTNILPTGATPTGGLFIVDWITSASSWIGKQVDTFTQVVNAPTNIINSIPIFQTPEYAPFAAVIGIAWWGISLLLIAAFIFGR
jgi:hypothetical protein